MKSKILFFSRGRGHGHAILDMEIAGDLMRLRPQLDIVFASYATGADTFRAQNRAVVDMKLAEASPFIATQLASLDVLSVEKPSLVVAHEEFAALVACQIAGVRSVFISAWLPQVGSIASEAICYADNIIVLEEAGYFPVPMGLKGPVLYSGRVFRNMAYTARDREKCREELAVGAGTKLIVVVTGGASSEIQSPAIDLIVSAFDRLKFQDKRLIWLSVRDYNAFCDRFPDRSDICALKYANPIEKLLSACDLVITKGTRGITLDAAAVGVPSISLSSGKNPIDDFIVPRIKSNVALVASAVDSVILQRYIELSISRKYFDANDRASGEASKFAAENILRQLDDLK